MDAGTSKWGIVGWILLESIWIIDLAVDLYTGEMTPTKLILLLMFCAMSAAIFISVIRRKRRKSRAPTARKTEDSVVSSEETE